MISNSNLNNAVSMDDANASLIQSFTQLIAEDDSVELGSFVKQRRMKLCSRELGTLACIEMHFRWIRGDCPTTSHYVFAFPEIEADAECIIDLLFTEYLERCDQGEQVDIDQLVLDFPELSDRLQQQIGLHNALTDEAVQPCAHAMPAWNDNAEQEGWPAFSPTRRSRYRPNIPGYRILDEVGHGGVGVVYKALDLRLQRIVAIKMLVAGAFANAMQLRRFKSEALAVARLKHPNIVQIYEIGEHNELPFLVLEFVEGLSLASFHSGQPISPRISAELILQIAFAMAFVHKHGVVHRDLKPANILLTVEQQKHDSSSSISTGELISTIVDTNDFSIRTLKQKKIPWLKSSEPVSPLATSLVPKIADFGFAKFDEGNYHLEQGTSMQTCSGEIFGTPSYMSPEQASGKGKDLGPESDIYSIGTMLYELLTGQAPLIGATPVETIQMVTQRDVIRPSKLVRGIPTDLETICLKCLEKKPSLRYQSADALAEDLAAFLAHRPIKARQISCAARFYRWHKRNPVVAVLSWAVTILLICTAVVTAGFYAELKSQLEITEQAKTRERLAKSKALNQLFVSLLNEAESRRVSRRIGQRFEGLSALRKAKELADSLELGEEQKRSLRDQAIGCLAVPDIKLLHQWKLDERGLDLVSTDLAMTCYAFQHHNGDVIVKSTGTGELIARLSNQPHKSAVMLSPNGKLLAVKHAQFVIYSIEQLKNRSDSPILSVDSGGDWQFLSDNEHVIGTGIDGQLVKIQLADGQVVQRLGRHYSDNELFINLHDTRAASIIDEVVRVIDLQSGSIICELAAPTLRGLQNLAWSANGEQLAAGPYDGEVRIWNIDGSTIDGTYRHNGPVQLAFDRDGESLIGFNSMSGSMNIWNLALEQPLLNSLNLFLLSAQCRPDGGFRVLVKNSPETGENETIELHEVVVGRVVRNSKSSIASIGSPGNIQFNHDGSTLLVGGTRASCVLSANDLTLLHSFPDGTLQSKTDREGNIFSLGANGVNFRRYDKWASEGTDILSLNALAGEQLAAVPHSALATTADGSLIALTTTCGVQIFERTNNELLHTIQNHEDVCSIAFSPDNKRIVTGGWRGDAKVWNIENGALVRQIKSGPMCYVSFSPDGKYLSTSSDGGKVWETRDWSLKMAIGSTDSFVTGMLIRFMPSEDVVVVSTSDGFFRLLNLQDGKELMRLTDPRNERVTDFAISPNGKKIAACIQESLPRVVLWDLHLLKQKLLDSKLE